MTIQNVTIGDKFKVSGKNIIAEVVDFYEVKSMSTGKVFCYECIAQQINGLATNRFETSFAQVVRNKI
jgi:hypothetical protein